MLSFNTVAKASRQCSVDVKIFHLIVGIYSSDFLEFLRATPKEKGDEVRFSWLFEAWKRTIFQLDVMRMCVRPPSLSQNSVLAMDYL